MTPLLERPLVRGSRFELRTSNRPAGFTLLELLVTVTIFSGILGALLISFLVGRTSYLSADAYIEVQQEARRGLDAVTTELREAGDIETAPDVASATLTFRTALGFDLSGGILDECPDGQVCWGAIDPATSAADCRLCVRYDIVDTQLQRQVLSGAVACGDACGATVSSTRILANNVTGPNAPFLYNDANGWVSIQLQVQKTSAQLPGSESGEASLSARVKLRNN